jgi:uncharacterized SAM-binding protein YcdF (DUF218 family)
VPINTQRSSINQPRARFGLVRRKEVWALTWRARLLLAAVFVGGGLLLFFGIHPFLALDSQVNSGALVVEGWIPEYALTNYMAHHSEYERIYTVGGPTTKDRGSRDPSDTYASVSHHYLARFGIPRSKLVMVPCWINRRDRTYSSLVSLREWTETNGVSLKSFDVVTFGAHARRSRLLAEKAFPHSRIGVVSLLNEDYEPDKWWRYSEGVKEVLSESAAYLYARFVFSPE